MYNKSKHQNRIKCGNIRLILKSELNSLLDMGCPLDFMKHSGNRPIYSKEDLLQILSTESGHVALALSGHATIVGYAVLDTPHEGQRWAKLDEKKLMELKAVEVSREFRNQGIAHDLISKLFLLPEIEKKILYITGYSWTWDCEYTGLSGQDYKAMLIHLYKLFGFSEYQTNEPNICLKPENFFMGRIGRDVSTKTREAFDYLRFGIFIQ